MMLVTQNSLFNIISRETAADSRHVEGHKQGLVNLTAPELSEYVCLVEEIK